MSTTISDLLSIMNYLTVQPFVNTQHDLKVVWINDMLDDECSGVRLAAGYI